MPVKQNSFEISSIEARRFYKLGEKLSNINVNYNPQPTLLTKIDDNSVKIDFRFTTTYMNLGVIKLEGSLIYEGDASALERKWKTENKMPDDVTTQVISTLFQACIPEVVMLARDIRLPPPIPMPQVKVGKGPQVKPSTGIEVA